MKQTKNLPKKLSVSEVRKSPLVHIHEEDKKLIDGLAGEWGIFRFDALRLVVKAGLEAIDNNLVDIKKIQEEVVG